METIGERLRRERLRCSMSQRQLAERVGVGFPHISKIERGRESPSDDLLGRLGVVLGVDPEELMLLAGRVPQHFLEAFAVRPVEALAFLRSMPGE